MRLRYGPAEEAFRAELTSWMDAHLPPREILEQPKRSRSII